MIFNSFSFLIFFSFFFIAYWFLCNRNLKLQNGLLLAGSYVFYAWADWRFLFFLIVVSALNYFLGIAIEKQTSEKTRKLLVYIALIQGIGCLVFFKYYNFFIGSINNVFHLLNMNLNLKTLSIIVPLGISFFTFRTISYILDVDKGKIEASKDWVVFFNYVSFFPSILSGPIDKSKTFVPQLENKRVYDFNQSADGFRQILWGLFKKVVIADNCAISTNLIFEDYHSLPASSLLLGAFLYAIQIYADFSGYSDIAIGISRLLGFNISKNFDFPFFSQNIAEFWRKWHISLTSWLTEYVFTPLSISFRDYGKWGLILAIIINFTICGIWHGANWTYVLFGFLHGIYFIPLIIKGTLNKKKKIGKDKLLPSFKEFVNIIGTFTLVMFTMVIFRSETIGKAFDFYLNLFSKSLFSKPSLLHKPLLLLIFIFITIEWFGRGKQYAIAVLGSSWPKPIRYILYYLIVILILWYSGKDQQFIYFKF